MVLINYIRLECQNFINIKLMIGMQLLQLLVNLEIVFEELIL